MPIDKRIKTTSSAFSAKRAVAAVAAADPVALPTGIDWKQGVVTSGGGVAETIAQLRRTRGKNRNPTKEQVAIRLDPEVLAAFRASGRGWQTRLNTVLKEWLKARPGAKARAAEKTGG
jgi:hypothetical protein